jgi:hypothetical protein
VLCAASHKNLFSFLAIVSHYVVAGTKATGLLQD